MNEEKKEEFGVENFIICLDVVIEAGNIAGKALEDNKIDLADTGHALMIINELTALGGVNFSIVPKEIKDFSAEEVTKISKHLKSKFDIPQEEVEKKIEDGAALLARLVKDAFDVSAYVKSLKIK